MKAYWAANRKGHGDFEIFLAGSLKWAGMAKVATDIDFPASTFLYRSREFFAAAEQVIDEHKLLNMPLYFLYFHTLELTMKAYLRFRNVTTKELKNKKGHNIIALY